MVNGRRYDYAKECLAHDVLFRLVITDDMKSSIIGGSGIQWLTSQKCALQTIDLKPLLDARNSHGDVCFLVLTF